MDLPWDLLIGAVTGVVLVTFGPYLLGFTGTGITAGSIAAKLMSVVAWSDGGAVARNAVAVLQSVGAAGLSVKGKVLAAAVGAALARVVGNTLWQHVQEHGRGQEAQGNDGEKQEENEKEEKKGKQEKKYSSRSTFESGRMRGDKLKQC